MPSYAPDPCDTSLPPTQARLFSTARSEPEPLTIRSRSAGQDSFVLILKIIFDADFRSTYTPGRCVVVFADTSDEHPETYEHVREVARLCAENGLQYEHLTPTAASTPTPGVA